MADQPNNQITIMPSDAETVEVGEVKLTYHFDVYDGPLDLLLTLVIKNKIDIYDISIADLLDQYMEQIARMLNTMYDFDTFVKAPSKVEFDLTYNRIHESTDISAAYVSAVGRGRRRLPPDRSAFSGIVEKKIVSVSSRIIHVMRRLWHGRTVTYGELFEASGGKSELVATFLAVLELVKGKRVRIDGDGNDAKVYMIEKGAGEDKS